jgi:hypothetical protein
MASYLNAQIALRAVRLRPMIGAYAARRYAERRGCSQLYRLALQLEGIYNVASD